eukprot:TRINITY_DN16098_c0_g2_i1.p1 TRINITY_DN16098_c0_g2~~TRINITY_DN16098_c0_g2_i1.p1  ORF type:complete len:112 (+),score=33.97 TRINITY_DN16098_c0_g2_i1:319-654(+)
MDKGGKGCEIVISGKLRGQRAKSMKFRDGYMLKTGQAVKTYVDKAIRHVMLRQGVMGVRVAIMKPYDPKGEIGGATILQPDVIRVLEPKEEDEEEATPTIPSGPAPVAEST